MRAAHPLAQQKEVTVEDLVAAQWILPVAGTIPRITYDNSFLRRGVAPPEPLFEVQPLSPVIRQLLRESDLVTILPLVVIEDEVAAGTLEAAAVRRRDRVPDSPDAAASPLPVRGARLRHRRGQRAVRRARAAQDRRGRTRRTRAAPAAIRAALTAPRYAACGADAPVLLGAVSRRKKHTTMPSATPTSATFSALGKP